MGYYIRILGTNPEDIPLERLREASQPAVLNVEVQADGSEQLRLSHKSGREIAILERNPVVEGQLGGDELREFIEEVGDYKPESAARWLQEYLPRVKVIYAFQLLEGTDVEDGWTPLHRLYNTVWEHAGGIRQADREGFSNEEGHAILWQFSDGVTGMWDMAVLQDGRWLHFQMDLGNPAHREAFWSGLVPEGVESL